MKEGKKKEERQYGASLHDERPLSVTPATEKGGALSEDENQYHRCAKKIYFPGLPPIASFTFFEEHPHPGGQLAQPPPLRANRTTRNAIAAKSTRLTTIMSNIYSYLPSGQLRDHDFACQAVSQADFAATDAQPASPAPAAYLRLHARGQPHGAQPAPAPGVTAKGHYAHPAAFLTLIERDHGISFFMLRSDI